ncbi:MAG: hypothetical protein IKY11_03895 [Rikenellaceae bacterium]|nr:hypothetical protein [Rikenellaceae bacterium]
MKNRFSKTAFICLVAMAAAAFTIPTLVVSPSAMTVAPNVTFGITLIYTNTSYMLVQIESTDQGTISGVVPIPEETRNQPTESIVIFQDVIEERDVERQYMFFVGDDDGNIIMESVDCRTLP